MKLENRLTDKHHTLLAMRRGWKYEDIFTIDGRIFGSIVRVGNNLCFQRFT